MLKKLCKCGAIIGVKDKRCAVCNKTYKERVREYDRQREYGWVYKHPHWLRLTAVCKARSAGLDMYQLVVNKRIVRGRVAHHIEEVKDNHERIFDIDNLIFVSDKTHSMIHHEYDKGIDNKLAMQRTLNEVLSTFMAGDG